MPKAESRPADLPVLQITISGRTRAHGVTIPPAAGSRRRIHGTLWN